VKRLCLFLLFVNIVYFFWGVTTRQVESEKGGVGVLNELSGLESLSLLAIDSALLADEVDVSAVEKTLPVVETKIELRIDSATESLVMSCYRIDGIASEKSASELVEILKNRGFDALVERELVKEEFWLIHSLANNWQESLQYVKRLKSKGVVDLWLVPSGEDKGVVSLGLFATEARAEKRLKQLAKKDINSLIRLKQKFSYSIKLSLLGDEQQARRLIDNVKKEAKKRFKKINC